MKKFIEVTDRFSRKRISINIDYISLVLEDEETGLAKMLMNDKDAETLRPVFRIKETYEEIKELLSQNGLLYTRTDK